MALNRRLRGVPAPRHSRSHSGGSQLSQSESGEARARMAAGPANPARRPPPTPVAYLYNGQPGCRSAQCTIYTVYRHAIAAISPSPVTPRAEFSHPVPRGGRIPRDLAPQFESGLLHGDTQRAIRALPGCSGWICGIMATCEVFRCSQVAAQVATCIKKYKWPLALNFKLRFTRPQVATCEV
jgi:hypothetical protein